MNTPSLLRTLFAALLFVLPALPVMAQVPVVTGSLEAGGVVGDAFTYRIQASNKPTRFSATDLPAGLTLNATTGLIRGTPTKSGTFRVTVTARNSRGASKAVVLKITVRTARPVITSPLRATATAGAPFSYQITAKNNPTSFGVSGPSIGLRVNAKTGRISGTPKSTGSFSLKISATNAGGTTTATLVVAVSGPPPEILER